MNKETEKTELDRLIQLQIESNSKALVEIAEEIIKSPPRSIEELESLRQKIYGWGQGINNLRGFIQSFKEYTSQ